MPLPPVVIELSAADAASPNAAELVRACTQAVTDGECRTGASEEAGSRAVAIVSWDAGRQEARIELGVRRGGQSRWSSRKVEFKESDPEPERWRTVGYVVGTLVGEAEREAEPPPAPAPAAKPLPARAEVPRPEPKQAEPRAATRLWIGVEAVAGPALDDGTWRWGAGASAIYDVPGLPVLGSVSARYLARGADEREVDVSWVGVGLGLGLRVAPLPRSRVEGRIEALLERIDASVQSPRRDSAGRWAPGGRLTLAAGPTLGDWGVVLASGELDATSQGTLVSVEDRAVGRAPPLTWALTLSARLRLF